MLNLCSVFDNVSVKGKSDKLATQNKKYNPHYIWPAINIWAGQSIRITDVWIKI